MSTATRRCSGKRSSASPESSGSSAADELTLIARELAWSQRTPEHEEVEEFAEQARVTQEGEQ